jgi:hypothetical protein
MRLVIKRGFDQLVRGHFAALPTKSDNHQRRSNINVLHVCGRQAYFRLYPAGTSGASPLLQGLPHASQEDHPFERPVSAHQLIYILILHTTAATFDRHSAMQRRAGFAQSHHASQHPVMQLCVASVCITDCLRRAIAIGTAAAARINNYARRATPTWVKRQMRQGRHANQHFSQVTTACVLIATSRWGQL